MLKIHQKKRQPGYPKVSSFHRKPFSGASLLWWQSSLWGISISSIFKRTILTSLSNLKFSPPMQIMAKHKFNPGQIFKPFCCAGFFGGCLLGFVWGIFCGGGLLFFFPLYLKWVAWEAVQSREPRSLLQVLWSQIADAITPLWPLEVREVGQKNLSENQLRVGDIYRQTVICQTCGCEAISHIAFQDPGASVPRFMQLQLKAFCAVWTAQFSANKLVCLLYWYLPMF